LVDNFAAVLPNSSGMPRRIPIPSCNHCGKPPGRRARRRGLCGACRADPCIRAQYPAQAAGRAAPGNAQEFAGPAKLPRRPTAAAPGSLAKIPVLAARAAQCRQLFHQLDLTEPPDGWGWAIACQGAPVVVGAVVRLHGVG
jgi:hypothetical protein